MLVGGRFSLCPFGGLCKFRVDLGCDGGGLLPESSFSSSVFLRRPVLDGSLAFSVARCYLYLVPIHHYWDRGISCLSHRTLLLQQ